MLPSTLSDARKTSQFCVQRKKQPSCIGVKRNSPGAYSVSGSPFLVQSSPAYKLKEVDVQVGGGGRNPYFCFLANKVLPLYERAVMKDDKRSMKKLACKLVQEIASKGGRFVNRDPHSKSWCDVTRADALIFALRHLETQLRLILSPPPLKRSKKMYARRERYILP